MGSLTTTEIVDIRNQMNAEFYFFCETLMPPEWYDSSFHESLCDFLQYSGNLKLVILPRTHLKTTICAVMYPLWRAVKDSSIRILEVSNTTTNAEKTVRSIRSIIEHNKMFRGFYRDLIPDFSKVRWSDRCACLRREEDYPEGTFESAGVGSNIIRRHFNMIIEDDTVAPKKDDVSESEAMPSREDIDQAIGFHKLTPPLLINDGDEQIVIGTRWCSFDHITYIRNNEKYSVFDKPAFRADGRSLYKRFSNERLMAIKQTMGSYLFSALYLNKPLEKHQMIFNPDWIHYYFDHIMPTDGYGVVTVDPADPPTGKKSQDYSAIVSCKHTKSGIYVRRYKRERVTDKQLIDISIDMAIQDGALKIRVEVDRYAHLQYGFREQMSARKVHFIIEPVKTRGKNKEGRIRQRLQPMFENGVIFLKQGMSELEAELFAFPNGVHDDLIDALAWQVEGIYPTESNKVINNSDKSTRNLPKFDDMLDTLYRRGRTRQYPFEVQLGGKRPFFGN